MYDEVKLYQALSGVVAGYFVIVYPSYQKKGNTKIALIDPNIKPSTPHHDDITPPCSSCPSYTLTLLCQKYQPSFGMDFHPSFSFFMIYFKTDSLRGIILKKKLQINILFLWSCYFQNCSGWLAVCMASGDKANVKTGPVEGHCSKYLTLLKPLIFRHIRPSLPRPIFI